MSHYIDPKEVLIYLNELGYTNITAQQLKEFIIDLKKLLKYDLRFGGFPDIANKEQSCPEDNVYCPHESCEDETGTAAEFDNENKTETSREAQKKDSVTVKERQKEQHIAVHIYDTKSRNKILHDHCIHINKLKPVDTDTDLSNLKLALNTVSCGISKGGTGTETESTIRSIRPSSTKECSRTCPSRASSKEKKSKVTFIRPTTSRPTFNKSDPVALYHHYQSEWKRTKIPGQDNRDDLRWAIREKMLSGPRVEVKSRCNVQRCGWR